MCILILPTICWGILQLCPSLLAEIDVPYHDENREKSTISNPINFSTITDEIEDYYNDRIPFRNYIISKEHRINGQLERFYQEAIEPSLISVFAPQNDTAQSTNVYVPEIDVTELYPDDFAPLPDGNNNVLDETISLDDNTSIESSDTDESDSVDEHTFIETEHVDATCTEDGYIKYECSDEDCDLTKEDILTATGHSFEMVDHVEASYQNYGHSIYRCRNCGSTYCDDIVNKLIEDTFLPPKEGAGNVVFGRFNWLFYSGNSSLDYYQGTNILSEAKMSSYLSMMQELQDACNENGKSLCYIVLPNREQIYPEYMPSYNIENTEKRELVLAKYIAEKSNISFLYPLNELLASKVFCEPCFPYDTHWNQAGGFIGTQALYKAIGIQTTNMLNLDIRTTSYTPRGLVATGALDPSLYTQDYDYIIDYKPDINITWTEGTDGFETPSNTYRAKSTSPNKQKLLLIGDSFRIAMIPYLEKDFAEVCISHRQDLPNIIEDIKDADVIVIETVERFDTEMFNSLKDVTAALTNE